MSKRIMQQINVLDIEPGDDIRVYTDNSATDIKVAKVEVIVKITDVGGQDYRLNTQASVWRYRE